MKYLLLLLLFTSTLSQAWDATGHRLVAYIAYQHLRPAVKAQVDQLTESLDKGFPALTRFEYDAVWMDFIKGRDIREFDAWHYIDQGFSVEGGQSKSFTPGDGHLLKVIAVVQSLLGFL